MVFVKYLFSNNYHYYLRNIPSMIFSFGIISDTQYADCENSTDFSGKKVRYYRNSLNILQEATVSFHSRNNICNMFLGDIVDATMATPTSQQEEFLDRVLNCIKNHGDEKRWHYALGNHDFKCFNRDKLYQRFIPSALKHICSPHKLYYDFSPFQGYRFIVLDGYDISVIGASSKEAHKIASDLLIARNPNLTDNFQSGDWFKDLDDSLQMFVPFNGGFGKDQLAWLQEVVKNAKDTNELCFLFSHMPLYGPASKSMNLPLNYPQVLEIIQQNCNIVSVMSGHDHDGGYAIDECGCHHIIPCAPLECREGDGAFASVVVHLDMFEISSSGKLPSRMWPEQLRFRPQSSTDPTTDLMTESSGLPYNVEPSVEPSAEFRIGTSF